jgi:hypothetical protein
MAYHISCRLVHQKSSAGKFDLKFLLCHQSVLVYMAGFTVQKSCIAFMQVDRLECHFLKRRE